MELNRLDRTDMILYAAEVFKCDLKWTSIFLLLMVRFNCWDSLFFLFECPALRVQGWNC